MAETHVNAYLKDLDEKVQVAKAALKDVEKAAQAVTHKVQGDEVPPLEEPKEPATDNPTPSDEGSPDPAKTETPKSNKKPTYK